MSCSPTWPRSTSSNDALVCRRYGAAITASRRPPRTSDRDRRADAAGITASSSTRLEPQLYAAVQPELAAWSSNHRAAAALLSDTQRPLERPVRKWQTAPREPINVSERARQEPGGCEQPDGQRATIRADRRDRHGEPAGPSQPRGRWTEGGGFMCVYDRGASRRDRDHFAACGTAASPSPSTSSRASTAPTSSARRQSRPLPSRRWHARRGTAGRHHPTDTAMIDDSNSSTSCRTSWKASSPWRRLDERIVPALAEKWGRRPTDDLHLPSSAGVSSMTGRTSTPTPSSSTTTGRTSPRSSRTTPTTRGVVGGYGDTSNVARSRPPTRRRSRSSSRRPIELPHRQTLTVFTIASPKR